MRKVILALIVLMCFGLLLVYKYFYRIRPALPVATVYESPQVTPLVQDLAAIGTSGAFVLVKDSKVVDERYWGYSNYEYKTPVDQKTLFQLGSLTKQFTGFVLLQLELEGKVNINKQVGDYFEGLSGSPIAEVTLKELIYMKAGLPFMEPWSTRVLSQLFSLNWTADEVLTEIADYDLSANQRRFSYSNTSYILLGAIVSKIEQKPFSQVLYERIFKPFKMYNTFFNDPRGDRIHATIGYYVLGRNLIRLPDWNYTFYIGSSGVMSNMHDLVIWHKALEKFFQRFPDKTEEFFPKKPKHTYAYGWSFAKAGKAFHVGEAAGFCSYIVITKTQDMAALTLNTDICLQPVMSEIEKRIDELL